MLMPVCVRSLISRVNSAGHVWVKPDPLSLDSTFLKKDYSLTVTAPHGIGDDLQGSDMLYIHSIISQAISVLGEVTR